MSKLKKIIRIPSPRKIWISNFIKKGFTPVDMHVHSEYSYDSFSKIDKIISQARKNKFGVAITDHNSIRGFQEIKKKADDILLIPGIEVRAHSGVDILVYFYRDKDLVSFYNNHIKPFKKNNPFILNLTEEEIISRARLFRCVISAPHPFAPRKLGLAGVIKSQKVNKEILKKIDLIEIKNGVMINFHNLLAKNWAKKNKKMVSAGSDSHLSKTVGSILTLAKCRKGECFLDVIKKSKAKIAGREGDFFTNSFIYMASELRLLFNKKGFRMFFENAFNGLFLMRRENNNFLEIAFSKLKNKASSSIFLGENIFQKQELSRATHEEIIKKTLLVPQSRVLSLGVKRDLIRKYTENVDSKSDLKEYDFILSSVSHKKIKNNEENFFGLLQNLQENGKMIISFTEKMRKKTRENFLQTCKKIGLNAESKTILARGLMTITYFIISKK